MTDIKNIESRFLEVTKLQLDLSKFPIRKNDFKNQQQITAKDKAKEFGFVTTPIFLVDAMILVDAKINPNMSTLDVCAGCGQFSIRMMRYFYNKFKIDVKDWLKNRHNFNEFQLINCAKLVYIFGNEINLFCGDAKKMPLLNEEDKGIMFFDEKTDKWEHNNILDKILKHKIILNNLTYVEKIFKAKDNIEKLQKILDKLEKINVQN